MPRVSIISGAYNACHAFSFERSLESILSQTYRDFEFIICDDGSTDKTWDVLCRFAERDGRIRLLKNEKNLGLAATLNRCIESAMGEYIARHDCDDLSSAERLEKQIAYLDAHPDIAVLGTYAELFDENGVWGEIGYPKLVRKKDFLFGSPHMHGSVVFRKEALLAAGGYRVAKETRRAEDYDLFMRMREFAKSANISEPLYSFCENKSARERRKYRYRVDEMKVRWQGFRRLGLMPRALPYVIKPLIVGLIPSFILEPMKNRILKRKRNK